MYKNRFKKKSPSAFDQKRVGGADTMPANLMVL